jgi:hypothetical protein
VTNKDWEEISYVILAIVGVFALERVWSTRIRPWIETTWGDLRSGELVTLPVVGAFDQADAIGLAVLVLPFLVLAFVVTTRLRRRRRAKTKKAAAAQQAD